MYGPSKLQLALTMSALFGNHYYHHSHKVKIQLGLEPTPEIPSIKNDPPAFNFDSKFESGIDNAIENMERHTNELPSQTVFQHYDYRGDYVLENKETVPHGAGTYEIGQSKIVGAFDHGNLKGPFKLTSREDDIVVKSVLDQDKMNGRVVTYSKGCKFEMDMATRNYIFTDQFDNKAYVQAMPGDFRYTKFYDKDGRKLYTEYKNSQEHGIREIFEEDGSKLTVEIKNGQPEGQSVYRDKYGDPIYKGSFRNGEVTKRWSLYTEVGTILGVCILSTFWPRNPKRTISRMKNSWLGLFKSKRVGIYCENLCV